MMGWKQIISDSPHFQIVGTSDSLEGLSALDPTGTLILADLSGSNDHALAKITDLIHLPHVDVLLVVDLSDHTLIQQLKEMGIRGILTTHCDAQEIKSALESIRLGKRFYCGDILDVLMQPKTSEQQTKNDELLSAREIEVLEWIVKGLTTNQIADKLNISSHTINSHRKNMLKKLGLTSPVELIVYAVKSGLVNL
ncbi:response regulator transcription factor [Reichenbachiella carrageenanivorans]|uniref:Response regulator transcription factor n=1 Tax=Reichenbachiella carrageenanivorans TaxID=2979869 RepID=A0ABY6DB69_9BACT|nr:response regulator transcription factor [Reichenbachiella carrageenanivorans]UXX81080.1 response regulator transcription factor [Reichenbachiella carrageenanivorans]